MKTFSFVLVASLFFSTLDAQDWNQWRGPNRDGVAKALELPDTLNQPKKQWAVPIGEGHASPVVWSDWIYLLTREGEDEVVTCLKRDCGKQVWQKRYPAPFTTNGFATSHGKGPKATPVVHDGKLITFGIGAMLSVYQAFDGNLLWQKQHFAAGKASGEYICPPCGMVCDEKVFTEPGPCPQEGCPATLVAKGADTAGLYYGAGSSPIVLGNLVIAHSGNAERGALVAYKLQNGEMVWERKGPGPGYSSPVVMTFEGVQQLVTFTRNSLISLDFHTGETLWERYYPDQYNENIITPVQLDGNLLLSGPRTPLQSIQVTLKEGTWQTRKNWHNVQVNLFMSSPVISNGTLFGFNEKKVGQFVAVNPQDGTVLWASEGRMGENASLVVSSGRLVCLCTDGQLRIFADGSGAEREMVSYEVSESPVWAHLVPDKGPAFFVKNKDTLARWSF